jgi:dimethylglycine dehydrogenase
MAEHTRVVVVGGGCVGAAIMVGATACCWSGRALRNGSTRLAGGLIPTYVRSDTASRMINKTIEIDRGLEADTGQAIGWHQSGQIRIARSPDRLDEYRSYMNITDAIGANAALLSPGETLALWPLIDSTQGILGALYHPDDG